MRDCATCDGRTKPDSTVDTRVICKSLFRAWTAALEPLSLLITTPCHTRITQSLPTYRLNLFFTLRGLYRTPAWAL